MKKINYCCRNFKQGSEAVYKKLKKKFPDIKQKKRDCLGNCKLCSKECFVRLGKKDVIKASSPGKLLKELKQLIG
ncbi:MULTISPECIES: DUF1450 domain-containing protein [Paenibacillus]|uniref:DUF1450 domain-containing protein n=1 Tax=Paenibacillus radicis (ex Xue et al. 2023) TaxID=2972489 RepID=A0ABT1Y8T7_9BACL|nr:DUF1450 domain-containing protein [Paenibacillus radicis (ex Xue et al. 2023)]MCR8629601.1 DUF1450 domain-containing protein [Paenibacillus radicis (ex Xue et al. 2023)]